MDSPKSSRCASDAGKAPAKEVFAQHSHKSLSFREIRDDVSVLMEPTKHQERPIHIMSVVLNLLQTALGVGILSLAATCQYTGLVGGALLLCGGGLLAVYVVKLMSVSMVISGTQSYEGLGEYCYGAVGRVVVQITLILTSFVALTCFLVPLKHNLYDAISHLLSDAQLQHFKDHGGSPNLCLGISLAAVIVPLCLLRRIDSLWFTSLVGVFFDCYFLVMSVAYIISNEDTPLDERVCHELNTTSSDALVHALNTASAGLESALPPPLANITAAPGSYPETDIVWLGGTFADFTRCLSIIACSFVCHSSVFPIYRELRTVDNVAESYNKITQATRIAMAVASCIYVIVATTGYAMYRELSDQASSILACYSPSSPAVIICYFGMCVVLMCGFPLILYSVRYCAATVFYTDQEMLDNPLNIFVHVGMTITLIAPIALVALFTDRLAIVMTVGGGVTLPFFLYILPSVLYLKVVKLHDNDEHRALLEADGAHSPSHKTVSLPQSTNSDTAAAVRAACAIAAGGHDAEDVAFIQQLRSDPYRYHHGYALLGMGLVIQVFSMYGTIVAAIDS